MNTRLIKTLFFPKPVSLTPAETMKLYEEAVKEVNEVLESVGPSLSAIKGLLATLIVYINSFAARNEVYVLFVNSYRSCMEKEASANPDLKPYVDLFPQRLADFTITKVMQFIRDNVTYTAVNRSKLNPGNFAVYYSDITSTILACIKEGLISTRILIEVRMNV